MKQYSYFEYMARRFDAEQKKAQKELAYRERQERYKQNLLKGVYDNEALAL